MPLRWLCAPASSATAGVKVQHSTPKASDVTPEDDVDSDDEDMVPMIDPSTGEWGGPTKGGTMPEPTRFGDWERRGRCTDF